MLLNARQVVGEEGRGLQYSIVSGQGMGECFDSDNGEERRGKEHTKVEKRI